MARFTNALEDTLNKTGPSIKQRLSAAASQPIAPKFTRDLEARLNQPTAQQTKIPRGLQRNLAQSPLNAGAQAGNVLNALENGANQGITRGQQRAGNVLNALENGANQGMQRAGNVLETGLSSGQEALGKLQAGATQGINAGQQRADRILGGAQQVGRNFLGSGQNLAEGVVGAGQRMRQGIGQVGELVADQVLNTGSAVRDLWGQAGNLGRGITSRIGQIGSPAFGDALPASISNYGTQTPMSEVNGLRMRTGALNRVGFDPAATQELNAQRLASQAAREAAAQRAQAAFENRIGARNQGQVDRLTNPANGRLPNAPANSALANSTPEITPVQQAKIDSWMAEREAIKATADTKFGGRPTPSQTDRMRTLNKLIRAEMARPGVSSPQEAKAAEGLTKARIENPGATVKEAGNAVGDIVKSAEDLLKSQELPGATPEKKPGLAKRIWNKTKRAGVSIANQVAGAPSDDLAGEIKLNRKLGIKEAKAQAALDRIVNRMSPQEAKDLLANGNFSDADKARLETRASGAKAGEVPKTGSRLARGAGKVLEVPKAELKAANALFLADLVGQAAENISNEGLGKGLYKTGGDLVEGVGELAGSSADAVNKLGFSKDLGKQFLNAGAGGLATTLANVGTYVAALPAWIGANANAFTPGKEFGTIVKDMRDNEDPNGVASTLRGIARNMSNENASRMGNTFPEVLANIQKAQAYGDAMRATPEVQDQMREFALSQAVSNPASPAPQDWTLPNKAQAKGIAPQPQPQPQAEGTWRKTGLNTPRDYAWQEGVNQQASIDYAISRLAWQAQNGTLEAEGAHALQALLASKDAARQTAALKAAYDQQNKTAQLDLARERQDFAVSKEDQKRTDDIIKDYFSTDSDKREAATLMATGILEKDPNSPLANALMTAFAAKSQEQNLGWIDSLWQDPANTPYGTTNPRAIGKTTEQNNLLLESGLFDENGRFVGNPAKLPNKSQQLQMEALFNVRNQQALAEEQLLKNQQIIDRSRKRSGIRRANINWGQ